MSDEHAHKYLYYIGYGITLLFAYIIQYTPFMIKVFGVYPSLILVLVIVVSMSEKDLVGAIFGLFAGILTDINSQTGSGFHAITYMLTGLICGLLVEILFQRNVVSIVTVGGFMLF